MRGRRLGGRFDDLQSLRRVGFRGLGGRRLPGGRFARRLALAPRGFRFYRLLEGRGFLLPCPCRLGRRFERTVEKVRGVFPGRFRKYSPDLVNNTMGEKATEGGLVA